MPFSTTYDKSHGGEDSFVPSSTPMLVSLFLILISFFIALNQSLFVDNKKTDILASSVASTFRNEKNKISFGNTVKPSVSNYALELENLFKELAVIKTTYTGDNIILSADKDLFYYGDESDFKPEIADFAIKFQDILLRWHKADKVTFSISLGLENYDLDKKRLEKIKALLADANIEIGIDTKNPQKFILEARYD